MRAQIYDPFIEPDTEMHVSQMHQTTAKQDTQMREMGSLLVELRAEIQQLKMQRSEPTSNAASSSPPSSTNGDNMSA